MLVIMVMLEIMVMLVIMVMLEIMVMFLRSSVVASLLLSLGQGFYKK